jgi:uncharacterized protein YceK
MRLSKVWMKMTPVKLLAVWIILIGINGCASVILHPIEKSDITKMPKAVAYTPEKDGWFISDYYLEQVVKAKVEK